MLVDYFQRGVLAGVVAGFAYALYMVFVGNPFSAYLHDAGHDHDHGHGHDHDHSHAVSETTNFVVSAGSGVLWAILLGGLFGVALYFLEPALPGREAVSASVLAGAGFLTVSGVPWLVLPPAAPGAEQLYGISTRLAMYVGLVGLGAVVSAAAIGAYRRGATRHPGIGLVAAALPLVAVGVALPLATPTIVTHPDLSSDVVGVYQALAAFSQAAIWLVIAASFTRLHRRGGRVESAESRGGHLASP